MIAKVGDYVRAWVVTAYPIEGYVTNIRDDGTLELGATFREIKEGTVETGPTVSTTSIEVVDNRQVGDVWLWVSSDGLDCNAYVYQGDEIWLEPVNGYSGTTQELFGYPWREDLLDLVYRRNA